MWQMRALLPLFIVTHALVPPPRTRLRRIVAPRANPFDEILDALDSMVGVSPLSEADMKSGLTSEELAARAAAKAEDAPPPTRSRKPRCRFFALLGLFPVAIMVAGLANGAKPFGLWCGIRDERGGSLQVVTRGLDATDARDDRARDAPRRRARQVAS